MPYDDRPRLAEAEYGENKRLPFVLQMIALAAAIGSFCIWLSMVFS